MSHPVDIHRFLRATFGGDFGGSNPSSPTIFLIGKRIFFGRCTVLHRFVRVFSF